jgi:S1-C subfamily serine protease
LIALMAVGACSERKPAEMPATVAASASASASAPVAPAAPASAETSAGTVRRVALPDFSVLVQKQGPAVVNVIIAVENTNLTSLRQFGEIIAEKKPGTQVALLVRRGDASLYVAVQVGAS